MVTSEKVKRLRKTQSESIISFHLGEKRTRIVVRKRAPIKLIDSHRAVNLFKFTMLTGTESTDSTASCNSEALWHAKKRSFLYVFYVIDGKVR